MTILDHLFWSQWKGDKGLSTVILNTNVGLVKIPTIASTKDPQFFREFLSLVSLSAHLSASANNGD